MASRRDQLQSYQFLTQRVISAFVMRETDPAQSPLRRGVGAVFAGLMVAVMVAAGFGVYGLLTKAGSSSWKTDGAVVIEKETGAAFVYQAGQLHPMLNYASALLATGSSSRVVFRESTNALRGVPRGVMMGIPNAPDSLPDAAHTTGAPWTLCTAAVDSSAQNRTTTTLALSLAAPPGGRPLADQSLLVRDPATNYTYLIWHGNRYRITDNVLPALFGVVTPVLGGTAWLNGIPSGADIRPIAVSRPGSPSPAAAGHKIGDLLVNQIGTGGVQYWMVFEDGLAPITELQKDIAVGLGAAQPVQISVLDTTTIPRSAHLRPDSQVAAAPLRPPALAQMVNPTDPICAVFSNAANPPVVSLGGSIPAGAGTPTGSRTSAGAVLADRIVVATGSAEVVQVMASSTSAAGGYYLVTDLGVCYAIASDDTLRLLGYQPANAVAMPNALVRLIPNGPALDPVAAGMPVASTEDTGR